MAFHVELPTCNLMHFGPPTAAATTAAGYIVPHQCFMLCRLEELIAFDCLGAVSAVEKQLIRAMKNETYRQELLDNHKANPHTAQR